MAYSLSARFPTNKKCFRIYDPGAYSKSNKYNFKENKAPFLSNKLRITQPGERIWTQAIYFAEKQHNIPNNVAFRSRKARFPYEDSIKDFETKLCECGIATCECPTDLNEKQEICHANVPRRLFKGVVPHSLLGNGVSIPSRRHEGYKYSLNGMQTQVNRSINNGSSFYDARFNPATDFYKGCKWSKSRSKRKPTSIDKRPGPADYNLDAMSTSLDLCNQQFRAYRRQTSRQPRYIEIIQKRNQLDNFPGPAHYTVTFSKSTHVQHSGSKSQRFREFKDDKPGPADYSVKRSFDVCEEPKYPCHAKLPKSAPFGVKANRFTVKPNNNPSPDTYDPRCKTCCFLQCSNAPFNSTSQRFKNIINPEIDSDCDITEVNKTEQELCKKPTLNFYSKTVRFQPLTLKINEPSPADLAQTICKVERHPIAQYKAPFFSSEGRFYPWHNCVPIEGIEDTVGPGALNLQKATCPSAVHVGPLFRAPRFPKQYINNPGPNEYKTNLNIETILTTYNNRLKENVKKTNKFTWKPPITKNILSPEDREMALLDRSIALLDDFRESNQKEVIIPLKTEKSKLLRYFLYKHPLKNTF